MNIPPFLSKEVQCIRFCAKWKPLSFLAIYHCSFLLTKGSMNILYDIVLIGKDEDAYYWPYNC